jgi:hypothetical protein
MRIAARRSAASLRSRRWPLAASASRAANGLHATLAWVGRRSAQLTGVLVELCLTLIGLCLAVVGQALTVVGQALTVVG